MARATASPAPLSASASSAAFASMAMGDRLSPSLPSRAVRWVNCPPPTNIGVRASTLSIMSVSPDWHAETRRRGGRSGSSKRIYVSWRATRASSCPSSKCSADQCSCSAPPRLRVKILFQPHQRLLDHRAFLAEGEADEMVGLAGLEEHAERDQRHAGLAHQPFAERNIGLVGEAGNVRREEVTALAR